MKAIAKYLPVLETMEFKDADCTYGTKKLFAVTQDIEVGDEIKVFTPSGNILDETVERIDGLAVYCKDVEHPFPIQDSGRVLGELSPNATWVKDGDEIEVMEKSNGMEKEKYLVVKCPTCNTFH